MLWDSTGSEDEGPEIGKNDEGLEAASEELFAEADGTTATDGASEEVAAAATAAVAVETAAVEVFLVESFLRR